MTSPSDWSGFFSATVTASGALAGLLIIGLSINIAKIINDPGLVTRSFLAIVLLMIVTIISLFGLIPEQSITTLGYEILITGVMQWLIFLYNDRKIYINKKAPYKYYYLLNILINQLSIIPYIICGYLLISTGTGMYWVVPAFIISMCKAVGDVWTLIIEINR